MNAYTNRIGLCKVGGKHLSDASNEPATMREIEAAANADARAILREPWTDKRSKQNEAAAMALQQARPSELDVSTWRT